LCEIDVYGVRAAKHYGEKEQNVIQKEGTPPRRRTYPAEAEEMPVGQSDQDVTECAMVVSLRQQAAARAKGEDDVHSQAEGFRMLNEQVDPGCPHGWNEGSHGVRQVMCRTETTVALGSTTTRSWGLEVSGTGEGHDEQKFQRKGFEK
jgi:hypothetical protein